LWNAFERRYLNTYGRRLTFVIVCLALITVSIWIGANQSIARRQRKYRQAHPRPGVRVVLDFNDCGDRPYNVL
jgi:hypothetical protein